MENFLGQKVLGNLIKKKPQDLFQSILIKASYSKHNQGRWEGSLAYYHFNHSQVRLTLDFSDIFADGFAFDSIDGLAELENSNIHSDNFEIKGPAADIFIEGDVNIKMKHKTWLLPSHLMSQTQCLLQRSQGGPIVGAAAFVLQKLLNDPLE